MSVKKAKNQILFYVAPMGYNNLGVYDYSLIQNIRDYKVYYFGNVKYKSGKIGTSSDLIYSYSDKKALSKIFSYLRSHFILFLKALRLKPSIIHFQWLKVPSVDLQLLRILKIRKCRIILTAHNLLPHNTGTRYKGVFDKIYSIADVIIVHSQVTKREMIEMFGMEADKIQVIPHGVLEISGSDEEEVRNLSEEFIKDNDLDGKTVFAQLGGVHKYKGIDLVVNTWKQIDEKNEDGIHLLIAGVGTNESLHELSSRKDATVINRFLSDSEFLALMRIADFILLPYYKISQSGVLLTALNEKKRIIVSRRGGLTEPFQFGEVGYILEELNEENLLNTIKKAASEKDKFPKDETWQSIFQYYDWAQIGRRTQELYKTVLE